MNSTERAVIAVLQGIALRVPTYPKNCGLNSELRVHNLRGDTVEGSHYIDCWRKALRLAGFKWLGNGAYGIAVSSPAITDKVLKIVPGDDGWVDYARTCYEQYDKVSPVLQKLLLRVYALESFSGTTIALVEKLAVSLSDSAEYETNYDAASEKRQAIQQGMMSRCDTEGAKYPLLNEAGRELAKFKPATSRLDLHAGNIMLRENGEWVITDPWC